MKYELRAPLGVSYRTDGDDVWFAKNTLKDAGYYLEPKHGITPYPDSKLFAAIKKFQKDNDLKIDGYMRPGGETENALFDLPGAKSSVMRCSVCGAPHGGVYSPTVCYNCFGKGFR